MLFLFHEIPNCINAMPLLDNVVNGIGIDISWFRLRKVGQIAIGIASIAVFHQLRWSLFPKRFVGVANNEDTRRS
jgi:hypothetical protein